MAKTKKSAQSDASPKRILRVHAEGAQNIRASDSKFSLDAKPDPYVVFVLDNVTHKCDAVNDVEPIKYFVWPNAVHDFVLAPDKVLVDSSLVIHVKDSDTISDRYIGGASIPLGPLLAGMQGSSGLLCQSKLFTLTFADEKFKKRKDAGEVKLTIILIDDSTPAPQQADRSVAASAAPATTETTLTQLQQPAADACNASASTPVTPSPAATGSSVAPSSHSSPEPAPAFADATPQTSSVIDLPAVTPSASKAAPVPAVTEKLQRQKTSSKRDIIDTRLPVAASTLDPAVAAAAAQLTSDPVVDSKADALTPTTSIAAPPHNALASDVGTPVQTMTIELVSAKNLTRPTSLGAMFDRKPDPLVVLEFYGMTKTSVALKDVDLKKPVEWTSARLEFVLPLEREPSSSRKGVRPTDLVVLVKDENVLKPTFMGGAKLSLDEFFCSRSDAGKWFASSNAVSGVERTVALAFGDEKLSKRKACGEITLRFHFASAAPSVAAQATTADLSVPDQPAAVSESSAVLSDRVAPSVELSSPDAAPQITEHTASAPVDALPPTRLTTDVKMLSIEALCGRNVPRPSTGATPKGVLKALFDRRPDPYVTFELDGQTKRSAALKDVDIAFFEWRDTVQVFEVTHKPYPAELLVRVRDDDALGNDPFMAGTRIDLSDIWAVTAQAPSGADAELVRVCPLAFADEKLTKQKACGEITLRFRWVYAESPLPVVAATLPAAHGSTASDAVSTTTTTTPLSANEAAASPTEPDTSQRDHVAKNTRVGYVVIQRLALVDSDSLVDPSLDLYVVAASFPSAIGPSARSRVAATTSVLNNATAKANAASHVKAEWKGEELVVPVVATGDAAVPNFVVELKDKNAITSDTQVADLVLAIQSVIAADEQCADVSLELALCNVKKTKTKTAAANRTVQLTCSLQFLPLGCALLGNSLSSGVVLTLFLVRGHVVFGTDAELKTSCAHDAVDFGLNVDHMNNQTRRGLLTFGKHDVETPTDRFPLTSDRSTIEWHTCLNVVYSSKQIAAARDRDSLDVDVQLLQYIGKKTPKALGSVQLNLWPLLHSANGQLAAATIRFGETASMRLEFAVASRVAQDDRVAAASATTRTAAATHAADVSPLRAAARVPSGNLHLLVLQAQNLVAPHPSEETAADLDPEVRVAIEPKYIKRKENPVRSMLKTRPLENAGTQPTWYEYLRLEYRLPGPPVAAANVAVGKAIEANDAFAASLLLLPSPVVQVGLYDIEVPGERGGSKAIGKAEVPLSAFLLSTIDQSADTQAAISMKIDVRLQDKVTGSLFVEGIFEPLESEKPSSESSASQTNMVRLLCRSIGKRLSAKAKSARSAGAVVADVDIAAQRCRPGRLEIHFVCVRHSTSQSPDARAAMVAHMWLSASMDDRRSLTSKRERGSTCNVDGISPDDVIWDQQATLYATDIASELLRVEILTLTGKPVGSLKLPLAGIQSYAAGQMVRDWHPLVASVAAVKPSSLFVKSVTPPVLEAMVGVAFFPDQTLFQPLEQAVGGSVSGTDADSVLLVRCKRFVFDDGDCSGSDAPTSAPSRPFDEVACKFVLLGDSASSSSAATSFQKLVPSRCSFVQWHETLTLELGTSPSTFVQRSVALGMCPMLRTEVVAKRKGGRFPEQLASYELGLVSILASAEASRKTVHLCTLYSATTDDTKDERKVVGVLQLEILAVITTNNALSSREALEQTLDMSAYVGAVPGVLCIRFLAGRNLVDVDPNGEQDPFVVAKVAPYFPASQQGLVMNACQTDISMNGGCHPQWHSPVFYLQVRDVRTDLLRVDVVDSNAEDHLADALIGTLSIALASLFPDVTTTTTSRSQLMSKTQWFETWLPIYSSTSQNSDGNAGEVRVDYRFIARDHFAHHVASQSDSSVGGALQLFGLDAMRDERATASRAVGAGTVYFHIVRAKNIVCSTGMQPGVRVSCSGIGFVTVSKPAKQSIRDPEWSDTVIAMEWPASDDGNASQPPLAVASIEIVDLSVRTANASAMAVVTFGFANFDAFLLHPTAVGYVYYGLGGSHTNASILLGCQFIPRERAADVTPLQGRQRDAFKAKSGQLHVTVLASRFDIPGLVDQMTMNQRRSLRFRLCNGESNSNSGASTACKQQFAFPDTSFGKLVEHDGRLDWSEALQDAKMRSMLFDCAMISEHVGDGAICVNPVLVCELVLRDLEMTEASEQVAGVLELPIFDSILLDGHLVTSWYPLSEPAPLSGALQVKRTDPQQFQLGEIKLELQYLPHLQPEKQLKPAPATNELAIVAITVFEARNLQISAHQVCVVAIDLMGTSMETMPSTATRSVGAQTLQQITWHEALEFPLSTKQLRDATDLTMRLEIRDALRGNVRLASCDWVVPPNAVDDSSTDTRECDDVVLTLQLEKDVTVASNLSGAKVPSEIRLSIRRLPVTPLLPQLGSTASSSTTSRVGLYYVRLDASLPMYTLAASLLSANSDPTNAIRSFLEPNKHKTTPSTDEWVALDSHLETSVVPVDLNAFEKRMLTIVLSPLRATADGITTAVGFVAVDARVLASVVRSPKTEFFQRLPVRSLIASSSLANDNKKAARQPQEGAPTEFVAFHLKFVKRCEGTVALNVLKLVAAQPSTSAKPRSSTHRFRVEARLQHAKSSWLRSSLGVADARPGEIAWTPELDTIQLPYSNEFETVAPVVQLVVYRLETGASAESGVREAYGQLSLLPLLADASVESGTCCQFTAPMATADADGTDSLVLHLAATFVGAAVSFDERMAAEAERKREAAFQLAQGAAELKRSFATMGGDDDTPLKISALKEHLLTNTAGDSDDDGGAARRARELLQHAADMETDGDLDRLFAAMDVNGDGMLSWSEYTDHMQSLHALAYASATAAAPVIDSPEVRDERDDKLSVKQHESEHSATQAKAERDVPSRSVDATRSLAAISTPIVAQAVASIEKVDEYASPVSTGRQAVRTKDTAHGDDDVVLERQSTLRKQSTPITAAAREAVEQTPSTASLSSTTSATSVEPVIEQRVELRFDQPRAIASRDVPRSEAAREKPRASTSGAPLSVATAVERDVSGSLVQQKRAPVVNSYVLDWKVEDVMLWLRVEMELPQYCDAIEKNAVNGKLLLTLTEAELESELGVVAPLHKRKLMNQIREFQDTFGVSAPSLQQHCAASPEKKATRKLQTLETTVLLGETPAFLKREQMMYQEKQRFAVATDARSKVTLKLGGGSNSEDRAKPLPVTTRFAPQPAVQQQSIDTAKLRATPAPTIQVQSESFADAMQDILESVRPHSPPPPEEDVPHGAHVSSTFDDVERASIAFPVIQIGSVTNTDELFEIVKQRVQQLGRVLQPLSRQVYETHSDFGDDDDDNDNDASEPAILDDEHTGLRLVYEAFTAKSTEISRAKFQDGVASLLSIDVSWHQFDLLFRRLDTDADGKLSVDEFCRVFERDHLTFERTDLLFLEAALVNFAIDKLETQQWTLIELFKAFDRDGGGAISIAEFATLARFLFTKTDKRRLKSEQQASAKRSKRLVYLLMSCLDASADRRISLHEFLRFFFVVWSARLMEVQDQLVDCESKTDANLQTRDVIDDLRSKKKVLRKALRTNFSRPFRDAMRCVDVSVPSPFSGLLSRLQLLPSDAVESHTNASANNVHEPLQPALQIWQVLEGQTSNSHRAPTSIAALYAETKAKATDESRRRVRKGKNEVLRTRLTRHREPERPDAVLQTPSARVSLDGTAKLKFDHRM